MIDHKLIKCDPASPTRCQGVAQGGQCPFEAEPGSKFCIKHGANKQIEATEMKALHDYRLQKWQLRMDDFAASERITSLRGEVGILRMTLEETLNMCHDKEELLLYSHRIQDLVMKIVNVVNSLNKIEMKAGNLLDKGAALILAGQIVDIIGTEIDDPKKIDRISEKLIDLVVKLAGKEPEIDE